MKRSAYEHVKCPHCNAKKLFPAGSNYTRLGTVKRYYCKNCHTYTYKPKEC